MIFKGFSFLILTLFYGIYFTKMAHQKKNGIKTSQIGTTKQKSVRVVEVLMAIATVLVVPTQIVSILFDIYMLDDVVRWVGLAVGFLGDVIFLLAVVAMKDSWRAGIPSEDKIEFVSGGIFSISRNPAFVGFDLMYVGICLTYCNVVTIICSLFAIIMLHFQILQEEKFLVKTFGDVYVNYKKRVFRYFGKR